MTELITINALLQFGKTTLNYPSMGVKLNFIGTSGLFDSEVDKWGITLYAI